MEPRAFGKYMLLHRLARGGMADLYLARSSEVAGVERLLVIKLVAARYSEDPSFVSMFEDEVRIVASLNHPNIGQVIDVGRQDGAYFLAMEYIHGRDLRQVLRRCMQRGSPVPVSAAVPVLVKICAALHHAHQALGLDGQPLGIVHRDVSPSNIMITYEGQVKLVDFGIAKAANRTALTVPGTIKGKLRYLSPEQVSGQPVDARTDVFCAGVCLWEATVGRHCFEGASDAHIYHAILQGEVRPPSSLLPGYPSELERIVLKALSLHPRDRQQSARALQRDLERFAASAGIALSDLALSRFMHEAFEEELADWELARRQGRSLIQHLQEVARRAEEQREHVVLVSGPGGGGDTPASGSTPAPPLQTLPPGGGVPREVPAPATSRRTILYGGPADAFPSRAALTAPGRIALEAAGLPVSASQIVEVESAGRELLLPGPAGEPDQRRTLVVDAASLAEGDPAAPGSAELERCDTLIEEAAGGRIRPLPITEPDTSPARPASSGPWPARSGSAGVPPLAPGPAEGERSRVPLARPASAPEPIIGRDRQDLEARRQQAPGEDPEGQPGEQCAERPPITGDWSAQVSGEPRPRTHPYFKDSPEANPRPPRNRMALLGLVLFGLALLSGLAALGWRQLRPSLAPGEASSPADAATRRARIAELESEPPGAVVLDLQKGHELGTTPLRLELPSGVLQVELALPGYARQRISLARAGRHLVTLPREAPATPPDAGRRLAPDLTRPRPAPAKAPVRKPRRLPAKKQPPADGELVNPFP